MYFLLNVFPLVHPVAQCKGVFCIQTVPVSFTNQPCYIYTHRDIEPIGNIGIRSINIIVNVIKGTVSVVSSDTSCRDENTITSSVKALSDQV